MWEFLQDLSQAALDYTANRSSTSEQPLVATIQALCSFVARLDAFSFHSNSSKKDELFELVKEKNDLKSQRNKKRG